MSDSGLFNDLDALVNSPWSTRTPCLTGRLLEGMDVDVRERVESLMVNSSVTTSGLAQVLRKWGFEVSYSSLTRHRRRGTDGTGCACP
jgi:hypothetical protein